MLSQFTVARVGYSIIHVGVARTSGCPLPVAHIPPFLFLHQLIRWFIPLFNGGSIIQGGAGFLPFTVSHHFCRLLLSSRYLLLNIPHYVGQHAVREFVPPHPKQFPRNHPTDCCLTSLLLDHLPFFVGQCPHRFWHFLAISSNFPTAMLMYWLFIRGSATGFEANKLFRHMMLAIRGPNPDLDLLPLEWSWNWILGSQLVQQGDSPPTYLGDIGV